MLFFWAFLPLAAINGGARVKIRAITTAYQQNFMKVLYKKSKRQIFTTQMTVCVVFLVIFAACGNQWGARVKIRAINAAYQQNFMKVLYKKPKK